jgi:hypothetical protein
MKKLILAVALNLAFVCGTVGCASVISALPTVIAYTQSGMIVLDTIKSFVDKYFRRNVNLALEAKISNAINKAELALHAALTTAQGAKNLDQKQIDAAFVDFKMAYTDLMALVSPLGVNAKGTKLTTETDGTLTVPLPLAFIPQVQ